jgi:Histidine kinase
LARRVLAAGDADRQRIERDLHDGVQQRLTGLRIRLTLAAECGTGLRQPLRGRADHGLCSRDTPLPARGRARGSTSPASRRSTMLPSTPDLPRFPCVPGIPPELYISRSATRAGDSTPAARRAEPDWATCTIAPLPSVARWPFARYLPTEPGYTAASRTRGRAQPQNGDPPAIEPLRPSISAASRHTPGPGSGGERRAGESSIAGISRPQAITLSTRRCGSRSRRHRVRCA